MRPHELRAARLALSLTQNELGFALELDNEAPHRTVRRWESGRTAIPGPVAVAVKLMLKAHRRPRSAVKPAAEVSASG